MCPRLLSVPTCSVSGLYVGFMNLAEKQSLAGFNPGNIFKLRLAHPCLLRLACCCFPHAAPQSSPPVLFILLRYRSVDIFFFLSSSPQKKKINGELQEGLNSIHPTICTAACFKKKPKKTTILHYQTHSRLRSCGARTLCAALHHIKDKEAKRHLSENVFADFSLILCNSQRGAAK